MKRLMTSLLAAGTATLGLGGLAAMPANAATINAKIDQRILNIQDRDRGLLDLDVHNLLDVDVLSEGRLLGVTLGGEERERKGDSSLLDVDVNLFGGGDRDRDRADNDKGKKDDDDKKDSDEGDEDGPGHHHHHRFEWFYFCGGRDAHFLKCVWLAPKHGDA